MSESTLIADHAEKIKNIDPRLISLQEFTYIDIASIDRESKTIAWPTVMETAEAPSRARQLVLEGDILVSTVRPNLNSIARVSSQYSGCIASTGFCVIRPKNTLDSRYLYHLCRSDSFIRFLVSRANGAGYPAVTDADVLDVGFLLLPLPEQQAIAQRLERADRLRRLRQHALTTGDQYLQNVFLDMFGDPETNPKGWEREELGELIFRFEGGTNFPPVADSAPASKYRVLKISAVTWGNFDPAESKPIAVETQIKPEIIVKKGDLLFSRANTTELVGSVSMVTEDPPPVVLPDKVWRIVFRPDTRLDPYYTMSFLRSPATRRQIGDLATGSSGSMKNISMGKANTLILAVPPIELQQQYALVVQKHERLRRMQVEALRQAEQLYETLLEEAFGD